MKELPKHIERQLVVLIDERRYEAAEKLYRKWTKPKPFSFLRLSFLHA